VLVQLDKVSAEVMEVQLVTELLHQSDQVLVVVTEVQLVKA